MDKDKLKAFADGYKAGANWAANLIGEHQDIYLIAINDVTVEEDGQISVDYAEIFKTPLEVKKCN
ncbi:MAG: hypothetical protein ACXABY_21795 [Candidatus Thorarchaeota archaeon]|jgi:hypothetical protein